MKMEIWRIVCSRADFIQIHWAKQRPLATAIVHDCTLDSRVKMKRGCRFDSGEGLALVRNFTGLCVSGLSKLDLCRTVLCFIFYLMSVSMSVFVNTKGMSNVYIDLDSVIKLPAERHENAPESWNAFEALPSAIDDLTVDERETMMKSSSCDWSGVTWPKFVVLPVYGTKPSFFCLVINFLGSGCRCAYVKLTVFNSVWLTWSVWFRQNYKQLCCMKLRGFQWQKRLQVKQERTTRSREEP